MTEKEGRRSSLAWAKDMLGTGVSSLSGEGKKKKKSLTVWNKFQTVSFTTDAQADFHEFGVQDHHSIKEIIKAEYLTFVIPGAVGILTAFSGKLIEYAVALLGDMRFGRCSTSILKNKDQCGEADWIGFASWNYGYMYYCVFSTLLAGISAFLTWKFAPFARGSGIPEIKTILGGFVFDDVLAPNTLCVKVIGLALSVAAGLSCGKEGPLVHIACCWSSLISKSVSRFAHNESRRVEMASCACAAGVAVAFGAPLGGVLFSLEEASTYFPTRTMIRAFFGGACASVVLLQLSENGKLTMFEATYKSPPSFIEWPIFVAIGCAGGCIGALFVHYNIRVAKFRAKGTPWREKVPEVLEVSVIALLTAITSFPILYTKVISNSAIHAMFQNCKFVDKSVNPETLLGLCEPPGTKSLPQFDDTMWTPSLGNELCAMVAIAGVLRFVQMTFTFGCGAPSGLFIPSLYTGAALGRILGICVLRANLVFNWTGEVYPGVYSMLGAAAVLGGVCRVTISLVVIMFELTGGLQLIVPFMIVCLAAKGVGDYFTPGIYDYCIIVRKYPFLHEPDESTYHATAEDCMDDEKLICLHPEGDYTCASLLTFLQSNKYGGFPITASDGNPMLLGYVYNLRLQNYIKQFMDKNTLTGGDTRCVFTKYLPKQPDKKVLDLSSQTDEGVLRVPVTCPAEQIHTYFRLLGIKLVFVVAKGKLTGMITKKSFIKHMEEMHHGEEEPEDEKSVPLMKSS